MRIPLILVLLGCTFAPACQGSPAKSSPPLIDLSQPVGPGEEALHQSFLVIGHSTSVFWPDVLQRMLDQHTSGVRRFYLLNATVGGAMVKHWNAEPGTQDYERTIGELMKDYLGEEPRLLEDAPVPRVAVCQVSLQLIRGQNGPVTAEDDYYGAELGANALDRLVTRLEALGFEEIYLTTSIYKESAEPEVGYERYALDRLLARGYPIVKRGPDVWSITQRNYPGCYLEDRVHLNEQGVKLLAEAWYRTLTGSQAREEIVQAMYADSFNIDRMMRDYLEWRRGG